MRVTAQCDVRVAAVIVIGEVRHDEHDLMRALGKLDGDEATRRARLRNTCATKLAPFGVEGGCTNAGSGNTSLTNLFHRGRFALGLYATGISHDTCAVNETAVSTGATAPSLVSALALSCADRLCSVGSTFSSGIVWSYFAGLLSSMIIAFSICGNIDLEAQCFFGGDSSKLLLGSDTTGESTSRIVGMLHLRLVVETGVFSEVATLLRDERRCVVTAAV